MPPNSSPTFTPHPRQAWSNFSSINLVLFLILITPSYFVQEKKKIYYYLTTPVLIPLHSALPLFLLLLTPPSPPTNGAPPTHPTPPTRLIPLTPQHGTTHPCHHEDHPYPSKSFL